MIKPLQKICKFGLLRSFQTLPPRHLNYVCSRADAHTREETRALLPTLNHLIGPSSSLRRPSRLDVMAIEHRILSEDLKSSGKHNGSQPHLGTCRNRDDDNHLAEECSQAWEKVSLKSH